MLNQRAPLLCIFGIFFVFFLYSIGFAQSGQGSDSALSGSQYNDLIKEIHQLDKNLTKNISELEIKMRDHVDKKISEVNDDMEEIQKDIAFMKGMFNTIGGFTKIFGGPLLIGIAIGMILNHLQNRRNKTKTDTQVMLKNIQILPYWLTNPLIRTF